MKRIFAILVVFATVTAAVLAISDEQAKDFNTTAEQAADTELVLEEWMIVPAFDAVELESSMDLESWMIDNESSTEESIELENWMINNSESSGTVEQDLELESWMLI